MRTLNYIQARDYWKARKAFTPASSALALVKYHKSALAFEGLFDGMTGSQSKAGLNTRRDSCYARNSKGDIRVELSFASDDEKPEGGEGFDAGVTWTHLRQDRKMGRTQAREELARIIEAEAAYVRKIEREDIVVLYIRCVILYRDTIVAESSLGGIETDMTIEDLWAHAMEVYQEAAHGLKSAIRVIFPASKANAFLKAMDEAKAAHDALVARMDGDSDDEEIDAAVSLIDAVAHAYTLTQGLAAYIHSLESQVRTLRKESV